MTECKTHDSCKNDSCLTHFNAASAGVAQSVAIAAHNFVDESRQQSIIRTTALGGVYAKWLANPESNADIYKAMIGSIYLENQSESVSNGLNEFVATIISPMQVQPNHKR